MTAQIESDSPLSAIRRRASPEELAGVLRFEQVRMVYDHLAISQLVMVLNALVFAIVQSLVIEGGVVVAWFSAVCAVALVRIGGWMAFQRASDQPAQIARWRCLAIFGAGASGAVWGASAIFLFPSIDQAHQVFVAFMLGGMVAGSMTTLGPVFPAFTVFAVLALLPAAIRYSMQQDAVHYAMGWMVAVYLVAVVAIARRSQQSLSEMLRLRIENAALSGELLVAYGKLKHSPPETESGAPAP